MVLVGGVVRVLFGSPHADAPQGVVAALVLTLDLLAVYKARLSQQGGDLLLVSRPRPDHGGVQDLHHYLLHVLLLEILGSESGGVLFDTASAMVLTPSTITIRRSSTKVTTVEKKRPMAKRMSPMPNSIHG